MTETKSQTIDLTQFEGHTPGPWGFTGTSYVITVADELAIGVIVDPKDGPLIAAAPDLLAAYKAALARAEEAERQRDEAIATSDARAEALREDAQRIYWAGAKDMRELLAEKMIAFGKSVHTEALPEFPACAIRALPIPAQEGK